ALGQPRQLAPEGQGGLRVGRVGEDQIDAAVADLGRELAKVTAEDPCWRSRKVNTPDREI
ncbi:MAG: hypothetical protein ACREOS_06705, partial [Candidatus Dormibacteraceae bacterium]